MGGKPFPEPMPYPPSGFVKLFIPDFRLKSRCYDPRTKTYIFDDAPRVLIYTYKGDIVKKENLISYWIKTGKKQIVEIDIDKIAVLEIKTKKLKNLNKEIKDSLKIIGITTTAGTVSGAIHKKMSAKDGAQIGALFSLAAICIWKTIEYICGNEKWVVMYEFDSLNPRLNDKNFLKKFLDSQPKEIKITLINQQAP